MKKPNIKSGATEANDSYIVDRTVQIKHYTVKGKSRTAYCDVRVTTDDKTFVSCGDAISKDLKDYEILCRRAEAVGYARCLAMIENAQGNVLSSDEDDNKE